MGRNNEITAKKENKGIHNYPLPNIMINFKDNTLVGKNPTAYSSSIARGRACRKTHVRMSLFKHIFILMWVIVSTVPRKSSHSVKLVYIPSTDTPTFPTSTPLPK